MTYSITPVGAAGLEEERTEKIPGPLRCDPLSVAGLHVEIDRLTAANERLRLYLEAARGDVAGWSRMWHDEVQLRIGIQNRLSRAMRVLASLGRLSPRMAGLVSAARKEVWR